MIRDIATEERVPVNTIENMKIGVLGEAICEEDLDKTTRDKLVQKFLEIVRKELKEYDDNIQIYRYIILTDPSGYKSIPKLLIHTEVRSIRDFKNVLKTLREYFQIQGGLRLPVMGAHYMTDEGDVKYFPDEENDLNLILDFIEYKCNNTYRTISKKIAIK
ncbi:hypothetical protein [Methanobrevibacter sp.]|uniref:hypothetical protein n=1 Tax=Methanobrevibacter sp. TaxID=66852 RepID=UPI0038656D0E